MIERDTELQITREPAIAYSTCYRLPFLSLFHADCMEIMKQYPDKYFGLCIVDPPYGIGMDKTHFKTKSSNSKPTDYNAKDWDSAIPNKEYFAELMRVSKNQIIWGGNYFVENLTNSSCWVVWDKDNGDSIHADCELAWTSFKTGVRKIKWLWHGMRQQNMKNKEKRIHPTQKPIALYDWLIRQYCEPNQKILDTHLGSGSIAIAVEKANRLDKMNLQFVGIEIDKEYYEKALNRIEQYCRQGTLSF